MCTIFDSLPTAGLLVDRRSTAIVLANQAAVARLEVESADDLIGYPLTKFIKQCQADPLPVALAHAASGADVRMALKGDADHMEPLIANVSPLVRGSRARRSPWIVLLRREAMMRARFERLNTAILSHEATKRRSRRRSLESVSLDPGFSPAR